MGPALFLAMMSSAWTPLDLGSKLKAWWDPPGSGNITLNGSGIASWTDKVGGYVLSQATAAKQPTYSATGFTGGLACATFDGVDDYLELGPVPSGIPTGASPSEIWVSCDQNVLAADTTTRFLVAYGGAGFPNMRRLARQVTGGVNQFVISSNTGAAATAPGDFTGVHALRAVFNGGDQAEMDGLAGTLVAKTLNTGTTLLRLGLSINNLSNSWRGPIRQVTITEPLTTDEAALLLGYLNGNL